MPKLNISFPSTTSSVGAADAGELTRLNSSGKLDSSFGGSAGSLATLDSGGKVPVGQIPDSVTSGMHYKGAFDASDHPRVHSVCSKRESRHHPCYRADSSGATRKSVPRCQR
mgnify:CR=1 FL=1